MIINHLVIQLKPVLLDEYCPNWLTAVVVAEAGYFQNQPAVAVVAAAVEAVVAEVVLVELVFCLNQVDRVVVEVVAAAEAVVLVVLVLMNKYSLEFVRLVEVESMEA